MKVKVRRPCYTDHAYIVGDWEREQRVEKGEKGMENCLWESVVKGTLSEEMRIFEPRVPFIPPPPPPNNNILHALFT